MTDEDRDEEWITAPEAVDRIRMRHGVSHGKAPKIFSIAFASDEVRRIRDMGHGVYYPYPHGTSPVYEGDEFSSVTSNATLMNTILQSQKPKRGVAPLRKPTGQHTRQSSSRE